MHEMSLCESILELLQQQAKKQHYTQVDKVYLEIGRLANIEISALQFCFPIVVKNSLAEHAELIITQVDGQAWCFNCQQQVTIEEYYSPCPHCGGFTLQVTGGNQMQIKELEVS